jgi:carboxyl-terminal processing protease
MSRIKTPAIAVAVAVVALLAGILWGGHPQSLPKVLRDSLVQDDVATRAQLMKDIRDDFYKPVSTDKLEEASLKGIVKSLDDRFSQYFTPKEAKQFAQSLSGQFEGVGMSVNSRDTKKGLRVARVFDGSPAQEAGIKPGDLIVAVDGKSIRGQSADVTTAKIRGPAGTKVTLKVRSGGKGKPRDVPLERKKLDVPLVDAKLKTRGGDKFAVVRLAEFDKGAHGQVRDELDKLLKRGAKGVVLDLRANPGGALDEGVLVASSFLPKDTLVVSTRGRTQPKREYKAVGDPIDRSIPVVVLVDSNSASASEIVTGALRDHKRATVIGQKTFGKGVFQELSPLPNDGLVKITVGSYYLPKGENLAGDGIDPAVKAKDNPKTRRDEALPTALKALEAKLRR